MRISDWSSDVCSSDLREEWGRRFGMTHFINSRGLSREETVVRILEVTDGGADYSFDATGNTEVMRTALECCHRGRGESIILGEIGRASCRERGGQYVKISVVVVDSKKQQNKDARQRISCLYNTTNI